LSASWVWRMNDGYKLTFKPEARKNFERLDKSTAEDILKKLKWLAQNVDSISHFQMTGQWSGYFRLRRGDYRIIYQLDEKAKEVIVEKIGHRSDVYDE
jgi:mRNA interferase RelE/StbE